MSVHGDEISLGPFYEDWRVPDRGNGEGKTFVMVLRDERLLNSSCETTSVHRTDIFRSR